LLVAVVPCRNEGTRIHRVLEQLSSRGVDTIVVDDGSQDNSSAVAASYGVEIIRKGKAQGYTAAVHSGIEGALSDGATQILTVDGDAAHNVDNLLENTNWPSHFDMAIGDRFLGGCFENFETKKIVNMLGSSIFDKAMGLDGRSGYRDITSGFRVYQEDFAREVLDQTRNCEPFALCYRTIWMAEQQKAKIWRFPADVYYDARSVLFTKYGELCDFFSEMLLISQTKGVKGNIEKWYKLISQREAIFFALCEEEFLFCGNYLNELNGYLFQRVSPKYLEGYDEKRYLRA